MTKKLNPNDAPPGYVAAKTNPGAGCACCAFATLRECASSRPGSSCVSTRRQDGHDVVFIKRAAEPVALDARITIRVPAATKAKAQRIGAAAVIAAIEAVQE